MIMVYILFYPIGEAFCNSLGEWTFSSFFCNFIPSMKLFLIKKKERKKEERKKERKKKEKEYLDDCILIVN